ncbi:MAG: hypothetical protein HY080_17470 [Gammaproteobacteria bacterium]|nr:hypothetical protein [Gammaproteobacteria bacterium]
MDMIVGDRDVAAELQGRIYACHIHALPASLLQLTSNPCVISRKALQVLTRLER